MMRRRLWLVLPVVIGLAWGGASPASADWPTICVNTTADPVLDPSQCLPGETCSFRAAIERADNKQVIITACLDPAIVPNAKPCPPGCKVLEAEDPEHFDTATGKWTLTYRSPASEFAVRFGALRVDFGHLIDGWAGPADNRVVFNPDLTRDHDQRTLSHALSVTGSDAVFKAFDVRGSYTIASILVKDGAANNQFGPGLVFDGLPEGAGITFQDAPTVGNRVVGIWCGVTGAGMKSLGLRDDCIQLVRGAGANTIGGPEPADRNVLSGSELGGGVAIESASTRDNVIQGNWIGLAPDGRTALPNNVGVRIIGGAQGTRIVGNVISGNGAGGVALFSAGAGTIVRDNNIGRDAAGEDCVGNGTAGVTVGGEVLDATIEANRIHCNSGAGVTIRDAFVSGVRISGNSITRNRGHAIQIDEDANAGVRPPAIEHAEATWASGRACGDCVVELFSDPATQAAVYEGIVTAAADGTFRFELPSGTTFSFVNLRATSTLRVPSTNAHNTSELSEPKIVALPRTPSPTPYYQTPTPTSPIQPTATPTASPLPSPSPTPRSGEDRVFLPWARGGRGSA